MPTRGMAELKRGERLGDQFVGLHVAGEVIVHDDGDHELAAENEAATLLGDFPF